MRDRKGIKLACWGDVDDSGGRPDSRSFRWDGRDGSGGSFRHEADSGVSIYCERFAWASAFGGGLSTAGFGAALHFAISLTAAAIHYGASRYARVLVDDAILLGPLSGMAIHVTMVFGVVPLTAVAHRPFRLRGFLIMLMVHMIVADRPSR